MYNGKIRGFYTPKKSGCSFGGGKSYTLYTPKKSGCKAKLFSFFLFVKKVPENISVCIPVMLHPEKSGCSRVYCLFYTPICYLHPTVHLELFLKSGCKNFAVFVLNFFIYTLKYMLHPDFYINVFLKNNIRRGGREK